MRAVRCEIDYRLIEEVLKLPRGCVIRKVYEDEFRHGIFFIVIEGPDFPEIKEGQEYPLAKISLYDAATYAEINIL